MLMKKLVLNNFRQYMGQQIIEFSEDPTKNVTLILGQNTSGKSTMVQAFRWVLYDDCSFSGKRGDKNAILNNDVAKTMRPGDERTADVTLSLVHKGIEYDISRTYIYHSKIPGSAFCHFIKFNLYYYDANGERHLSMDRDSKLKEILPESLAEYFFFDGEKIAQSRISSNVKDSINTIMGLVPLERMLNHLNGGRYNAMKSLRDSLRPNNGVASINTQIERATRERDNAIKNRDEANANLQKAAERETEVAVELARVKDIAGYAAELRDVNDSLDKMKDELEHNEDDIIKSFSPAMMESMLNLVSLDIRNSLSDNDFEDKGIPGMDATAIHHLLDRGKCICGSDLKENDRCRKNLLELLTYLPPESIGSQITHLNGDMEQFSSMNDKQTLFGFYNEKYKGSLKDYQGLEQRQIFLMEKVKGDENADKLAEQYEEYRSLKNSFQNNVVRYEAERQNKEKELARLNSDLTAASREDEYNAEIAIKMEYVQALYNRALSEYDKNSGDILNEVRSTLIETFKSMYHGHRNVELTPDYKVRLTVGGESLDNSKGLDTVQNFAFIASLVKVARSRVSNNLSSESFPLVMDAVFSNTDGEHIRNICEVLPKLSEQSILAIMEKDWDIASESLKNYVGKKYIIKKKSETYSQIIEVKEGC